MLKGLGVAGIIALVIFLIVIGPILVIWSLNTLFPVLAIPYALETWFAVVLLGAFLRANVEVKKS
jgi:hypothetical protein